MVLSKPKGEGGHPVNVATLKTALRPVESVPTLWRLNGCGTTMLGRYYDSRLEPRFYSLLFITFLLIPICPLRIYLVAAGGGQYAFHATISRRDFNAIYKHGYAKLIWNGVAETVFVFVAAIVFLTAMTGLLLFFRFV
jgi:hypothetical protein